MLVFFLKIIVMLDKFVLEIECICFILGRVYIIVLMGYVMSCLIFLVVSFGVLVFIVIWILVILGKVFKFNFGIIIIVLIIVVNSVIKIRSLLLID